jgi:hypothetical protein
MFPGSTARRTRGEETSPGYVSSSRELIADRQAPDAFAGRCEDGVAQCRREGRQPRLADAARRHVDPVGNDPHMRDRRRLVDADDLEAIKVVLLDAAVLEADPAPLSLRSP